MKIFFVFLLVVSSYLKQTLQQSNNGNLDDLYDFTKDRLDELNKKIEREINSVNDNLSKISLNSYEVMQRTKITSDALTEMKKEIDKMLSKLSGFDDELKSMNSKIAEGNKRVSKAVKKVDDLGIAVKKLDEFQGKPKYDDELKSMNSKIAEGNERISNAVKKIDDLEIKIKEIPQLNTIELLDEIQLENEQLNA